MLVTQWANGEIEKYEFYWATRFYSAERVAKAARVDVEVVRDRRRYLRQLEKQGRLSN